ncbi:MAG TPA: TolC family protein, partial [Elusimicrobiota bacterium]|nr:TolC family protein [Elusimicrobiota bacterium]
MMGPERVRRLSALLSVLAAPAFAADPAGLAATVQAVLRHDAGLQAAEAQLRQAQSARDEARAARYPSLSARGQLTRGDQPVYVFGSLLEQGRFGPQDFAIDSLNHPGDLTNIQSALDLAVPLFTGFELSASVKRREL